MWFAWTTQTFFWKTKTHLKPPGWNSTVTLRVAAVTHDGTPCCSAGFRPNQSSDRVYWHEYKSVGFRGKTCSVATPNKKRQSHRWTLPRSPIPVKPPFLPPTRFGKKFMNVIVTTLHVSPGKWEHLCFPSSADREHKQNTCSSRCKCMLKASQSQQGRGMRMVVGWQRRLLC